jgi:hypothetical protein
MNDLLNMLSRPFEPGTVEWKPGASKDNKCMALAYADLRAYQEQLDKVCGIDWSCKYIPWGDGRIICELTIAGVTRASTGEADAQDEKNNLAGSVTEAMAFKRACAAFGLGRYLYNMPSPWVDFEPTSKRISKSGLIELEQRYSAWYNKTLAALAKEQSKAPRQVDASTGEIVDSLPVTTDVIFQAEEPVSKMSDEQRKKLNAIGHDLYADEWDIWRHKHAEIISKGRTMSSNNLTRQETSDLIDKLTTLTTFEMLGQELYGEQWEAVCQRNAKRVSAGQVEDSDSLTTQQLQTLIDGMMTVKAKRAQQPIAQAV